MHLQALRETVRIQAECAKTLSAKEAYVRKLAEGNKKEANCSATLKNAVDDLKKAKIDYDEQLRQRDAEKTAALAAQQQKCNDEKTVLTDDKNKSVDDLKKAKTDFDEQLRQMDAEKTAALAAQQQKCTDDKNKWSAELERAKKDLAKTIAENDAKFQTQLASEKAKYDAAIKKCENEKTTLNTAKKKCDNDLADCLPKVKKCSSYPGYTYDSSTRVCYKILKSGFKEGADAAAACKSYSGGRLIRIDNAQIHNFVKSVMVANSVVFTWIDGVRQGPSSLVWKDSDNNDLTFFNWALSHPGSRCCVLIMRQSGEMYARNGIKITFSAICEIIPRPAF